MSRCFPYPPIGYSLKSASDAALIESIKLQKERKKAKAERKKEKKREKKERRREREGRKKQNSSENGHVEKIHKEEKSRFDLEGGCIQMRREDEDGDEQLERSDLTEEHGLPCSQNPRYSSDSTQNNKKRRKHALPHGNVIRIRLPLRNHNQPDPLVGKEWHSSNSVRTDLPAQHKYGVTTPGPIQGEFCSYSMETDTVLQDPTPRPGKVRSSTSGGTEVFAEDDRQTASNSSLFENEMQRAGSLYKDLVENWIPRALLGEQIEFDDQEWIFGRKQQDRPGGKRFRASNDFSNSNNTLWPRAQHLPGADIYALPFTLPF